MDFIAGWAAGIYLSACVVDASPVFKVAALCVHLVEIILSTVPNMQFDDI